MTGSDVACMVERRAASSISIMNSTTYWKAVRDAMVADEPDASW